MKNRSVLAASLASAIAAPLVPGGTAPANPQVVWPTTFEGRVLTSMAPTPLDRRLARDFPGRIARFSDGRRQIVLRSVPRPTRQLHPARDCFAAIGYRVAPVPMVRWDRGTLASCFQARRGGAGVKVCEQVADADGGSFPDISSWYWPALSGRSRGPWIAVTTVEQIR